MCVCGCVCVWGELLVCVGGVKRGEGRGGVVVTVSYVFVCDGAYRLWRRAVVGDAPAVSRARTFFLMG